jgi:hypothetical protein
MPPPINAIEVGTYEARPVLWIEVVDVPSKIFLLASGRCLSACRTRSGTFPF